MKKRKDEIENKSKTNEISIKFGEIEAKVKSDEKPLEEVYGVVDLVMRSFKHDETGFKYEPVAIQRVERKKEKRGDKHES